MKAEKFQAYVFREIRRLRKRFVALGALEWLIAIVHPLMDCKSPHDGKPLSASQVITFVRLWRFGQSQDHHPLGGVHTLLCMPSHVLL